MRTRLREAWTHAAAVAFGVALVGALLVYGAEHLHESSFKTVAQDLAAAVFTAGLLGLLYETLLRQSLVTELLEKIHLRDRLARSGLTDVSTDPPDWSACFDGKGHLILLPMDPVSWLKQEWPRLLQRAKLRRVDVDLYLPKPAGAHLVALAARIGPGSTSLGVEIKTLHTGVKSTWTTSGLVKGSTLVVHHYDAVPAQAVFIADDLALVVLSGGPHASLSQSEVTLTFDLQKHQDYRDWIDKQIAALNWVALAPVTAP